MIRAGRSIDRLHSTAFPIRRSTARRGTSIGLLRNVQHREFVRCACAVRRSPRTCTRATDNRRGAGHGFDNAPSGWRPLRPLPLSATKSNDDGEHRQGSPTRTNSELATRSCWSRTDRQPSVPSAASVRHHRRVADCRRTNNSGEPGDGRRPRILSSRARHRRPEWTLPVQHLSRPACRFLQPARRAGGSLSQMPPSSVWRTDALGDHARPASCRRWCSGAATMRTCWAGRL